MLDLKWFRRECFLRRIGAAPCEAMGDIGGHTCHPLNEILELVPLIADTFLVVLKRLPQSCVYFFKFELQYINLQKHCAH